MMASLFAGVSGLKNHQIKMNVVGDNIANINTIGFKLGRVTFQEALVQTLRGAGRPTSTQGGANPLQLGLGMSLNTIDNIFLQGGLETTGKITDLAIQGSGFFVLSNGQQDFYTRAGAFGFDANSNMVNPGNGFVLQGKMADVDGTVPASAPIGNIMLPFGQQDPARASSEIVLGMNLDSEATESSASLISAGSSNVTNVSGYAEDGAGGVHTITITGENAIFSAQSGVHAKELTGLTPGGANDFTATAAATGTGSFSNTGNYSYTIIAINGLGHTEYISDSTTNVANATDTVTIDWSAYPLNSDVISIQIYRKYGAGEYGQPSGNATENGLVAEIDMNVINPTTSWEDDGSDSLSITEPPSTNTTTTITGEESLSAFGITNVSNLQISVDNEDWVTITQLTTSSTVNDMIVRINSSVQGVTASIENNQIQIKRDYAGNPSAYNVRLRDVSYSDELLDVGAGDVTVTSNLDGSGLMTPGQIYHYAVVALNSRGETTSIEFTQTVGAGDDSLVIDWSAYPDLTDAVSVKIYRRLDGEIYTQGSNGLVAEVNIGAPNDYTDTGIAATNENPPTTNSTIPDICLQMFGNTTFTVNNGQASTLEALDVFVPNITGIALTEEVLTLITDPDTGIITGISSIGGGGITVSTDTNGLVGDPDGSTGPITSSTLVIETEDTQHATSITAYDSQGGKHTITITFTKSWNNNEWYWEAGVSGTEIIRSGGSGTINFNADGSLASFNIDGGSTSLRIDPNNGAEYMSISLMAGTPGGFDGLTGFASSSTASARSQDGYGLGVLSNISIDPSGTITGMFTNGVSRVLAQIYIADFNNPGGLLKIGRNTLYEWCEQDIIPHRRAGRLILFSRKRIQQWL